MPERERNYRGRMLFLIVAVLALVPGGCLAVVAGLAAGGAAGGYLYYKYDKGKIYRDYPASLADVRNAVHAALLDLHFQIASEKGLDGRTLVLTHTTDGKKVKIFMTDPGSLESKTILPRVYKITPAEIKALADAHKADIQVVGSDDIVLTMVDNNPGAIGVVNVYSINSQVKVLKIDGKLPMEQGYLLHGN